MILETERLVLRKMTQADSPALCRILQDEKTMYAYEGAFSDEEVQQWLDRQLARYAQYGFGLWLVVLKETGKAIGQCGVTMQPWDGREVLEVGYLFERAHWHHGYATEAARALKNYAFQTLKLDEIFSTIRTNNYPSIAVAKRNGMECIDCYVKYYYGKEMPHYLFRATKKLEDMLR